MVWKWEQLEEKIKDKGKNLSLDLVWAIR